MMYSEFIKNTEYGEISLDYIKDIEKCILMGFLKRFKREGFNFGK